MAVFTTLYRWRQDCQKPVMTCQEINALCNHTARTFTKCVVFTVSLKRCLTEWISCIHLEELLQIMLTKHTVWTEEPWDSAYAPHC